MLSTKSSLLNCLAAHVTAKNAYKSDENSQSEICERSLMLSNASLIAKHTLKIGATNHHHSIPSRFTNWANIAGTMKAITIGPRTVPASFTEWARSAKLQQPLLPTISHITIQRD